MKIICQNYDCKIEEIKFNKKDIKKQLRFKKGSRVFENFNPEPFKLYHLFSWGRIHGSYEVLELQEDIYDKCVICPICNEPCWLLRKFLYYSHKNKFKKIGKRKSTKVSYF